MVKRLVIEGDDGIRRWGYWVDDGMEDENPTYMPAGTMRSSLFGQWTNREGRPLHAPPPHLDPGTVTFRQTSDSRHATLARWQEETRDIGLPAPLGSALRPTSLTPRYNMPSTPSSSAIAETLRPQTSHAVAARTMALAEPARFPSYTRAQIELLARKRYQSRLTNSGGLLLTRVTGY